MEDPVLIGSAAGRPPANFIRPRDRGSRGFMGGLVGAYARRPSNLNEIYRGGARESVKNRGGECGLADPRRRELGQAADLLRISECSMTCAPAIYQ